jgi:tRNA (guanine-N7-)-methyltransferase
MDDNSIRSFKRRGSRVTPRQGDARNRLMDQFTLADFSNLRGEFESCEQIVIEIGTGMGEATREMALANPNIGILAVEVHRPGIGSLLADIEELELSNVRVAEVDAISLLEDGLPDKCVDGVRLYFPDPWPKTKHHKRRIFQKRFLDAVSRVVAPGGFLHVATDWINYANWMEEMIEGDIRFVGGKIQRPDFRPLTKFEKQGIAKGHVVTDFWWKVV